jgi:N-acetylglucosamine kinase-like BadF-type ATPase
MFIGVDGGGTKTAFALIDAHGHVVAHVTGDSSYYPEVGVAKVERVISDGIADVLQHAGLTVDAVRYAFFGLPAYGEDRGLQAQLDQLPLKALPNTPFRCGNDMLCSWAGSLACRDGISVIAGTGSIAYGQYAGREARAGGWGELFSDEGSAYWIAREGLNAFSRMSDGRLKTGPLHALLREQLALDEDIDLCALLYGDGGHSRRDFAKIARIVHEAADVGDEESKCILRQAGEELASLVQAVYRSLNVPSAQPVTVSYSGSVLERNEQVLAAFTAMLTQLLPCRLQQPVVPPVVGAALYAGQLHGASWSDAVIARLADECKAQLYRK